MGTQDGAQGLPRLLTIPEAAAELRCSERTVRRAIKRGEIPATLFGGKS